MDPDPAVVWSLSLSNISRLVPILGGKLTSAAVFSSGTWSCVASCGLSAWITPFVQGFSLSKYTTLHSQLPCNFEYDRLCQIIILVLWKDQSKDDEAYDMSLALELVNVTKLGLPFCSFPYRYTYFWSLNSLWCKCSVVKCCFTRSKAACNLCWSNLAYSPYDWSGCSIGLYITFTGKRTWWPT